MIFDDDMVLSEVEGQVFLSVQVRPGRTQVDSPTLQAWLVQKGYVDFLVDPQALDSAAQQCNANDHPFVLPIARRAPEPIQVQLAPDAMHARITLAPPPGMVVSVADVMDALLMAGVVAGIDDAAVRQACATGPCKAVLVASGVLPQDGQDAVFETLVQAAPDRSPQVNADGLIDYRERGAIVVVHAGTVLMRRQPATPGIDGCTVCGQLLEARHGVDAPFAAELPGSEVSPEDCNVLQACVTGQPVQVSCGVMVEPVLRLAGVNLETGNIYYDGTVHVEGEVAQGMKVQASGDIVVGAMVDGGLLEAGGSITVSGGVIAHARLSAKGSISARFAEAVHMYAGVAIVIDDMALECELQSLNQITVGAKAPQRGRLIGGSATAMMRIAVPILGSPSSGITKVVLGANPELETRHKELQLRITQEQKALETLDQLVTHLRKSGDPKGMLGRASASQLHAQAVLQQSLVERDGVDAQLALARNARLVVSAGVAGAVDLSFGRLTAPLRRDLRAGMFRINGDGVIVYADASGYEVNAA